MRQASRMVNTKWSEECFILLQNYLRSGVPTGGLDVTSSDINTIQEGGGV